jgi:predicted glycoside hydrolase/deacetylase ChbG (UPF0249 family)
MEPNPALKKLGFSADDRAVILHADDVGMCQASAAAFADLHAFGIISSGAVMVPCPWFLEIAAYARGHPEADLGVHLTLTSEYETYRWGPISTRDAASGLMDEQGCFPRTTEAAQESADPEAAGRELEAQVERAIAAGMRPTHVDTHMGTVAHPKLIPGYLQLALKHRLPLMMFRLDEAGWRRMGLNGEAAKMAVGMVQQLEGMGVPLLDRMHQMRLDAPEDRLAQVRAALAGLEPGLTHFIVHPARDTPELRAITPADWPSRAADYQTFMMEELREIIRELGLQVIGYRALQELMPA